MNGKGIIPQFAQKLHTAAAFIDFIKYFEIRLFDNRGGPIFKM
jgi:hypothetical protein